MLVNAYKEVTFSSKKCHKSCEISMLGWALIHTSQPLDGWTTINVRLYQCSTFQEHNLDQISQAWNTTNKSK